MSTQLNRIKAASKSYRWVEVDTPLTQYCLQYYRGEAVIVAHSLLTPLDGILYIGNSWERAWELFNELTAV